MGILPWVLVVYLLLIGLYGIVTSRNLIHLVVCLTIVQSSTYVLLLAVGYRWGGTAPVFFDISARHRLAVDPVVQALCLTDIVVEATVLAILLALAIQAHRRFGTLDPKRLHPLRG